MKHKFSNKDINIMENQINSIIDSYLLDLYGELNEQAEKHIYTKERIKLLMYCAYHAGVEHNNLKQNG